MNADRKRLTVNIIAGIGIAIAFGLIGSGIRGCATGPDGEIPVSVELGRVAEDLRLIADEQQLLIDELRLNTERLGESIEGLVDVKDTLDRNRGVIDGSAEIQYDSYSLASENDELIRRGMDIIRGLQEEGGGTGTAEQAP